MSERGHIPELGPGEVVVNVRPGDEISYVGKRGVKREATVVGLGEAGGLRVKGKDGTHNLRGSRPIAKKVK